jgi:hypothetical protein
LRSVRSTLWLASRKLSGSRHELARVQAELPAILRDRLSGDSGSVEFAVPCISGCGPGMPRGQFGWLARFDDGRLFFLSPRRHSPLMIELPAGEASTECESRFLCEKLLVHPAQGGSYEFVFEAGSRGMVDRIAEGLAKPLGEEKEAAVAV